MSVINYYDTSDSWSGALDKLRKEKQQEYLNKERIQSMVNRLNQINSTGNELTVEQMESTVASSINISDSGGELGDFSTALSNFLTAVKEGDKELFNETAKRIIALKNGMLAGKNITVAGSRLNEEDIDQIYNDIMYSQSVNKGTLLDVSNRIGRAGEYLAEIHQIKIGTDLIKKFAQEGQGKGYTITMEATGKDPGQGQLNIRPVSLQTDNRLVISAQNGSLVAQINFSTKMVSGFSNKNKTDKKASIKLRTSSLNVLIHIWGHESEVLNGVSLHRNKKHSREANRATDSYNSTRKLAGMFLIAQMLDDEKIVKGRSINDAIDYTIIGTRIVPEVSIFNTLYTQVQGEKLAAQIDSASVSKIREVSKSAPWNSTEDAENYIRNRAIMLKRSI